MNLLFRIVYAAHANGTHHKLALDALRHLQGPDAEGWRRVFLEHCEVYLEGSKAPDKEFKDFKNHVLHVGDELWGGAPEKVESWYGKVVDALKREAWHEAVWAAGIMSHYYTDPIHPFHTAQSKAENEIHRAVEWSISKSYGELRAMRAGDAAPIIETGDGEGWIKDHVIAGAEYSHPHYETLISHYDFALGVVDPPAGLDDVARTVVADLLAYAAVGHARLIERAVAEAGVAPPEVSLTAQTFVAALKIPAKWVTRKIDDAADRAQVEAMFDELAETGAVERTLPEDDAQVRGLYEHEVAAPRRERRREERRERRRQSPLPQGQIPKLECAPTKVDVPSVRRLPREEGARRVGAVSSEANEDKKLSRLGERLRNLKVEEPSRLPSTEDAPVNSGASVPSVPVISASVERDTARVSRSAAPNGVMRVGSDGGDPQTKMAPRCYLELIDDIEAAPSIGPKTAARFETIGITTVARFLDANPAQMAEELGTRHITEKVLVEWQQQARLVTMLPGLRGGHAQLLVGAGLTTLDEIASSEPADVSAAVLNFAQTSDGQRVLRDGSPPDIEKIYEWVQNARAVKAA